MLSMRKLIRTIFISNAHIPCHTPLTCMGWEMLGMRLTLGSTSRFRKTAISQWPLRRYADLHERSLSRIGHARCLDRFWKILKTIETMLRQHASRTRMLMRCLCTTLLIAVAPVQAQSETPPITQTGIAAANVAFDVVPAGSRAHDDIVGVLRKASATLGDTPTTLEAVGQWSDSLTNALRQGGYPVGQVLVTEPDWQASRQGAPLKFTAFPGRIHEVKIDNKSRVKDARLYRLITKALCGADTLDRVCVLQTSRLERTTQLLQDVPGVAIAKAPQFSSGGALGGIDVLFSLQQRGKPLSGDIFIDNQGIEATGLTRLGVTGSGNNFFGLGESYALTLTGTEKRMWTGSLTGSIPIFDDGLRLTGGFTRQQYTINASTRLAGVANTAQLGLSYPITRGLDRNVWVGGSYLHSRTSTSYVDFENAFSHSTLDAFRFSLQGNNGDRAQQLRTNIWSGEVALTAGRRRSSSPATDAAVNRKDHYGKLGVSAFGTYALNTSGDFFLSGRANGQYASTNLDPSEKLSVGGPGAVRAYRADEGSFDDGVILNLGVHKRVPIVAGNQLQFGLFSDFAIGKVNHKPWSRWESGYVGIPGVTNRRILSGYGLSVEWLTSFGATFSASVSKAYGFSSTSWVDPGKKPVQYWLSVSWAN